MARAAMAAISSLAAEADSIVTVLLFSFWRWQGTTASSTISIWRLERYMLEGREQLERYKKRER